MLIWSSLSLFGLWIVHRTLRTGESLQIFSSEQAVRIRLFIFLTVVMLNFALRDQLALLIFLNIVIFLSPWWLPKQIQRRREALLKEQFIPILDHLILSMKTGKAFRMSFQLCAQRMTAHVRYTLNEFLSAVQYQKEIQSLSTDDQICFFFRELLLVDQAAHKPVDRLKALRRRLSMERSFRQKSRQALLQVRFQSWVITAMYLLVLLYVHSEFGIQKHLQLVTISGVLFATGLLVVHRMGKRYRWKI